MEEREKLEIKKKLLTLVLALSMVTVAATTNGMEAKAATVVPTKVNLQIYAYTNYDSYGTSNSYPSGSVEY